MTDDQGMYAGVAGVAGGVHESLGGSWNNSSDLSESSSRAKLGEVQPTAWSSASHQGYFIDGAEAFAAVAVDRWLDIASACPGHRVFVGRSCLKPDGIGSYWWQAEDVIGADGRPMEHPTATHWRGRST